MNNSPSHEEKPFIIWTLRRAGGTNLGQALFKLSKFNAIEHEPFNIDRIHGKIHLEWRELHNIQETSAAIDKILSTNPLIKHCFEITPHEINKLLAEISTHYGYRHLFLYRELPTDRLLSLNYAQKTGVWGAKQKEEINIDEKIFEEKIDIDRLLNHENESRNEMTRIHGLLRDLNAEVMCLSFEELYYNNSYDEAMAKVQSTFNFLNINSNTLDDQFFIETLKGGAQGTKEEYLKFQGSEEFVSRSSMFERFIL
ncbi:MAG: hypothetical protein RLZZ505_3375 [Verrucomicrobiota bacterium]|jgi:hypothetical protein